MTAEEGQETCWACGAGYRVRRKNDAPPKKSDLGWLERAHVVSASAGGGTEPSNFFLLCGDCHREQPDGAPREAQEAWLISHESQIEREYRRVTPVIQWIRASVPHATVSDVQAAVAEIIKAQNISPGLGASHVSSAKSSILWNMASHIVQELQNKREPITTFATSQKNG
jgi:hypothetical protein